MPSVLAIRITIRTPRKEAKALLAAAGQGSGTRTLDFMVRDLNHHKPFGAAIQEMLRTVNIQTNIRTVVESVWFGDAAAGNYDLCVGAIVSSLLDPSDYFKPGTGPTARNYVKGHNPKDYFGIYDVVRSDTFWLDKA